MNARPLALLLLAILLPALPSLAAAEDGTQPGQTLDIPGVTAIRVIGEAASIHVTTGESDAPRATLGGRRTGWFANWYSSWFFNDCRTQSRMRIEDAVLTVEAGPSSWLEPSDCEVTLDVTTRKGVSVDIRQAASQVRLAGEFSTVSLETKAADFTLEGHAETVRLTSDALRSRLNFDRTEENETIAIAARALDTALGFTAGTRISYDVQAAAALVDSALPNTAGAKPSVAIKADYVRAVIR
ncbi:hypothetical protein [Aureimonas sp. AU20]|uniref:hypothetical protein n=1 Tax=Aureimonas sp. AU20 TaxID=1349819 RepID=UPI0007208C2C|nr:hypothetical protein [Aureimonas sp. AU20]ALN75476.1 hypothetical protein M673_22300 [Aureimonas sp. AU20]